MAISDRDRQVLQEFEDDLRIEAQHHHWVSPLRRHAAAGPLAASTGVALGLVVLFLGLRLDNTIGTCVGVAGAMLLIGTACLGVHDLSLRRGSRQMTRPRDPRSWPPR